VPTSSLTRSLLVVAALIVLLTATSAGAKPPAERAPTAIFYYAWFGTPERDGSYEHWAKGGHNPPSDLASSFYPARGPYSSSDSAVLKAQMAEIAGAGINEIVYSWWGWGSPTDVRLPSVAAAARRAGLVVAVHLEPYIGRTAESVANDIAHLETLGISEIYLYEPFEGITVEDWGSMTHDFPGIRFYGQTELVGTAAEAGFAGVYTYDVLLHDGGTFQRLCNQAHVAGLLCLPSVGPGFDARRAVGIPRVKGRRGGLTYDSMWQAALAAQPDVVTITSYNEWEEGTQIEPARGPSRVAGADYDTYNGAYGYRGAQAPAAYLARTAYWTRAFASTMPAGRS